MPTAADHRFTVGSIECRVVTDGSASYNPVFAFPGIPPEELSETLKDQLDEKGNVLLPYNPLLIRVDRRLALFDTGLGTLARETADPAGHLQASLAAAEVRPADIDIVIISHGHPDHIGGLTELARGQQVPVFERARHYFWNLEWEFWTTESSLAQLPEFLAGPARIHLPPLQKAGLVELVSLEIEVLPGVRLVPAPGHTPGHMAVAITGDGKSALCVGDAFGHELHVTRIDAVSQVDVDPSLTVQTRRRVLEWAERDQSLLMAYHFRAPGHVQKIETGYGFVPGGGEESTRAIRTANSLRDRTSSFR